MNQQQAQDLVADILDIPHEGELQVGIHGADNLATRFNDCAISQNVSRLQTTLTLTARLEQKKTSLTINTLDDKETIKRAIKQVFASCRHMPDDEEVMPAMGQELNTKEHAYCEESAALETESLGEWAAAACREGANAGVDLAGLLSIKKQFHVYADSVGGFAYERYHRSDFHVTATGENGSGWAENQGVGISQDDVMHATKSAIDKCIKAQNPKVYKPKPTTVILEPQAVGDLISMAFWYGFNQRSKDEERSAFSNFDQQLGHLSLYSDPANNIFPTVSFSNDGLALNKNMWLEDGKLQQLLTGRYWAEKNNLEVKPAPEGLILSGEGKSLDDLIQDTDDGILVTRFWYIRSTDGKTLGFTGMTRDGIYRIKNGEVTQPLVDMRWNESAIRVLQNVVASGVPTATGEMFAMTMPALKVADFHFTSLSG
jgi:predicted Zn-dependent protease